MKRVWNELNTFLQAVTFMTRLPVRFQAIPELWPYTTAYYPLVGFIIGVFLFIVIVTGKYLLPPVLVSAVALGGWVWISGGLHLDGLMDTADGLGSARTREQAIEIMKDSRVGAMGVLAGILLLIIKLAALLSFINQASLLDPNILLVLVVIPGLARLSAVISIFGWPYLPHTGMGSELQAGLQLPRYLIILIYTAVITFFIAGPLLGLILFVFCVSVTIGSNRMIVRRLGGLSGDTYGALIEGTEAVLLITAVSYFHIGGMFGW